MERKFLSSALTVLLFALGVAAPTAAEEVEGVAVFEAWLKSQMDYRGLPGIAVGVVYDQELVWSKGFGFADVDEGTPMTTRTRCRIASISKLFTSIAIMRLSDEGKLRLDDPVATHLDEFQIASKFEDAPEITIRHLLTHTSGLPREGLGSDWNGFHFPDREAVLAGLREQSAVYAPGRRWKYSNLALSLAGYIVREVSGRPYERFIQEAILDR